MRYTAVGALFLGAGLWLATSAAGAGADATDPFLWLEQVNDPRAMDWVKAENAKTTAVLEKDERYGTLYQAALRLAQAKDRIPEPAILGGGIYNLWQDADHAHGLWRRTSLADYQLPDSHWQTVLDLDALSAAEKANWFWGGIQCAEPAEQDCMVQLSDGGEDAVTGREFDLRSGQFVAGGFALPKGKQDLGWQGSDALLVSREWSPGELTSSGYPYVVKRLGRGQPLSAATEIYRGDPADVGVSPFTLHDGAGHELLLIGRYLTFFESEYRLVGPQGLATLALPRKVNIVGLLDNQLIVETRQDWRTGDGKQIIAQGSVVAVDVARMRAAPGKLRPTVIYAPEPRKALAEAHVTRGRLLVTELDNVRGRAYVYTPRAHGQWSRQALPFPDNASIGIVSADLHSDRAFLEVTGFLTPESLWLVDLQGGAPRLVKSLPPRFDASHLTVEQLEAVSKDGTHVPYFIVHANDIRRDGSTPLILEAYGGFQISETPGYSADLGKLWLERGGAYALANIRGGGEFGPAWHEAGLKTKRQRIYDDFAAVGADLIARGYTSSAHLGIRGGSNGGLLMGVEFNQRPELWSAVDIQVPLLDMLRYEQIDAGSSWVGEYGSVRVPEERAFLASISPYHNLKAGVHYPLPLIWTTSKDDRVGPQHARKFAAKMASLGLPYLFYEVIEGGHGAGATLDEEARTNALEYTYFSRQLGLPAPDRHFATQARPIVELLAGNWSISWLDSTGHAIGTGEESWKIAVGETAFVEENRSTVNGGKADEYAAMWWDDKAGRVHGIWCEDSINDEGCSGFDVTVNGASVILNGEWEFQGKRQQWREVLSITAGELTQSLYIGDPGAELKLAGVIRGTRH
jgi:prolyl oligopeptidase